MCLTRTLPNTWGILYLLPNSWFQINLIAGHKETVSSLAFSSDGLFLASGGLDASVKIWDLSGNVKRSFGGPSEGSEFEVNNSCTCIFNRINYFKRNFKTCFLPPPKWKIDENFMWRAIITVIFLICSSSTILCI